MIAALVAMLVGRGIAAWLATTIVYGVIALLGVGVLLGVRHWIHSEWNMRIAEPYRVEGDARTTAKLQPKIDSLTKERDTARQERDDARSDLALAKETNDKLAENNKALVAANEVQAKSIAKWQSLAAHLKAANAALQARFDAEVQKSAADIARLREEASQPSPTVDAACKKAKEIMEGLAQWARQRQPS